MPVQTSYPGVYVQEVPSGVRTIAGVSTSVAAFIGSTKRGPINKAVKIFNYSEFERKFGGISSSSELSYSVKQFFLNGGSIAIIVRLATDPIAATWDSPDNNIKVEALDAGTEGNKIELQINYLTSNPDSTFNLIVNYISSDNPTDNSSETFTNLSMNSSDVRFVENLVGQTSKLVKITRTTPTAILNALGKGKSESGPLDDVATLVDATHNRFLLRVNGLDPVTVQLNAPGDVSGPSKAIRLSTLCAAIEASVKAQANGQPALADFTCVADGNKISMTSGKAGENSRVEALPSPTNNVSVNLKLGLNAGGKETDAVASIRPEQGPDHSSLTSGDLKTADIASIPGPTAKSFRISMDGSVPDLLEISPGALTGSLLEKMTELALRIETAVRALKTFPSYQGFSCTVIDGTGTAKRLVLTPGSRGDNSDIVISEVSGDSLASSLKLLVGVPDGATSFKATNIRLQGGSESPITEATAYNTFVGSKEDRTGIYALEAEDIFNILCLPGIVDPGILMESDAYCRERRAFLIIDAPPTSKSPNDMASTIAGTSLPKSNYAAVYYPWIKIADPMNGGQLRVSSPSGTIAGLYARIDSSRGVWKAPAGTEANLVGVQGVEYKLNDRENGLLNPLAVNCLRLFPDSGCVSWGSRTLAGSDQTGSEYKYIPIRRTALFIEESLYRGLKWVVFEPNDEPLWAQIRLNVGAFMHDLFRQGAFQGTKKQDAYFVKCDSETTTQNDINLGVVNIWVGFAPLKPAEFVILYLQQMTGQIQV